MEKTTIADGEPVQKTTVADGEPMEKTTIADGEPMERTTVADGEPVQKTTIAPKLMKKTKLDKQINYFWSKYPSGGSIVSYAEEYANKKTFPEGFISKFVKEFKTSKAVMERNHPPRVLDSEVKIAMAAANQKVAASKKNKKTNPTDFESVKEMLLSSKIKERELSAAQVLMSRIATEFSYVRLDSSMSEEELRKAEEARREAAEKAKMKKEREDAKKSALKKEREEKKLDAQISHLENATKNSGYVRPYPTK